MKTTIAQPLPNGRKRLLNCRASVSDATARRLTETAYKPRDDKPTDHALAGAATFGPDHVLADAATFGPDHALAGAATPSTGAAHTSDCGASVPDATARRLTETAYNAAPPKTENRELGTRNSFVSVSSFDPTLPQDGALIIAEVLRNQFNGLLVMVQNIPAGPTGPQGVPGIQGPPFAQAIVDAVNTLPPGTDATVGVSFDGTDVHFVFNIPRGAEGTQGPPGEVTNAQLSAAIIGTSSNTNAVATMDVPFTNDPPTLADIELVRAKYNELVLAARR